MTNLLKFPK